MASIRLEAAVDYTCLLPENEPQVRLFCLMPIVLALATLEALLLRAPEALDGVRISISRVCLAERIQEAQEAVHTNDGIRALCERLNQACQRAARS